MFQSVQKLVFILFLNSILNPLATAQSICPTLFSPEKAPQEIATRSAKMGKVEGTENLTFSVDLEGTLRILDSEGQALYEFPYRDKTNAVVDSLQVELDKKQNLITVINRGNFSRNHVSIWSTAKKEPLFSIALGDITNISTQVIDDTVVMINRGNDVYYYIADLKTPDEIFALTEKNSGLPLPIGNVGFIAIDKNSSLLVIGMTDKTYQVRNIIKDTVVSQGKFGPGVAMLEANYTENQVLLTDDSGTKEIGRLSGVFKNIKNKFLGSFGSKSTAVVPAQPSVALIKSDGFGDLKIINQKEGWKIIEINPSSYPWIKTHGYHRMGNGEYDVVRTARGRVLGRANNDTFLAVEGGNDTVTNRYMYPNRDIEVYASDKTGPKLIHTITHEQHGVSVISVEFTANNKNLVVIGSSKPPQLWSLETGKKIADIGVYISGGAILSPSKRYILNYRWLYQNKSREKTDKSREMTDIVVYDTTTGKFVTSFKTLSEGFQRATFINDNSILALESDGKLVKFEFEIPNDTQKLLNH